jgi:hypothetical protein
LISLGAFASSARAQTAVMLDGRVLTQKVPLSLFATEGPVWNLDLANQGILVTGKKVTIPATVNGTPLKISGSSVLGQDGEALTGIGATDFARLLDANAVGTDRDLGRVAANLGPRRLGASRSLFSTSEARRATANALLIRDPQAQTVIEQNYFQMVQRAHQAHADVLPADFLERAGLRGTTPADWVYPPTSGGTLKSAGHVYVDANGSEFYVPDVEVVIELSENVAGGVVRSLARGDSSRPDSFVMDDLLLIFNQDPRFGAEVLGLGEAVIPRDEFFKQVVAGRTSCDVIGHMVGDHVMFVQEVLTEFTDPTAGIHITADRFSINVGAGEARWRGTVDKPQGVRLVAVLIDTSAQGVETRRTFAVALAIDPLTGAATYSARNRRTNLANLTHIEMQVLNQTTGALEASERFDIRPFRQ